MKIHLIISLFRLIGNCDQMYSIHERERLASNDRTATDDALMKDWIAPMSRLTTLSEIKQLGMTYKFSEGRYQSCMKYEVGPDACMNDVLYPRFSI